MATATGVTAARRDILLQENATFVLVFIVKTGDPLVVVDITGSEAEMKIRKEDSSLIISLTSSPSAGIAIDGTNGKITVRLTPAQTNAMDFADFPALYDLRLIYSDATVDRLIQGSVKFDYAQTQ